MITKELLAIANNGIDTTVPVKGKKYVMVVNRVQAFREICPQGTIDTNVIELNDNHVVIQAKIYDEKDHLLASGTAEETKGATQINQTSWVENCETSAVGRALGMLGIGSEANMASAEEITAALINQVELPSGRKALGTYCSEHALVYKDVYAEHNLNKTAPDSAYYEVLAEVMKEQGE